MPGYQKVGDDEARARYEKAWGVPLPNKPGLNNFRMVDAILDGQLHALFVVGEELALVDGNAEHVQEALEKVDFLVVQEIFMTRPRSLPMWCCRGCRPWRKRARSSIPKGGFNGFIRRWGLLVMPNPTGKS